MQDDILSLKEQLNLRKEKLNFFREEQPKIVDLDQKFNAKKKIEEEEREVADLEKKLEDLEQNLLSEKENVQVCSIADAFKLRTEFSTKTSLEEIKKINDAAILLERELFGNLFSETLNNSVTVKHYNQVLFEEIAFAEKLEIKTISDIYRIRKEENNEEIYTLKILIVSALTISILHFKKNIDREKLNILNMFVNDEENNIWERALVGLYLGLKLHENRLERFQVKINTFSNLRSAEKIQASILMIDQIMQHQYYECILEFGPFYEADFLKNSANWFLPFTEIEPKIKEALTKSDTDLKENEFKFFLFRLPFLDCMKFAICEGLIKGNVNVEINHKIRNYHSYLFNPNIGDIANAFNPYYKIISTIYLFDKYFSKEDKNKIFQERKSIADTQLKDFLLNDIVQLKLKAEDDFAKKKFDVCIVKLKKIIEQYPNDYNAISKIAKCYVNIGKDEKAIVHYQKIHDKFQDNPKIKYEIAACCMNLRNYEDAITYYLEIKAGYPKERDNLSKLIECYVEIDEYEKAILILQEIEKDIALNVHELTHMAVCYENVDDTEKMISYIQKAYDLDNENMNSILNLAHARVKQDKKEEAEELLLTVFNKNSDDTDILSRLALLMRDINVEKSQQYFNRIDKKGTYSFETTHNIYKYYLVEGDTENINKLGNIIFQSQNYKFDFLIDYCNLFRNQNQLDKFVEISDLILNKQVGRLKKIQSCIGIANVFLYNNVDVSIEYYRKASQYYENFQDFKNDIEGLIERNIHIEDFSSKLLGIKEKID